jgi:hypothetical protein
MSFKGAYYCDLPCVSGKNGSSVVFEFRESTRILTRVEMHCVGGEP